MGIEAGKALVAAAIPKTDGGANERPALPQAPEWRPDLYMKFERERTRAARDLLAESTLKPRTRFSISAAGPATASNCCNTGFRTRRLSVSTHPKPCWRTRVGARPT